MSVPGLCPCVYLYLLVLNESAAAYKVYQGWAVKSALNKHRGSLKMLQISDQDRASDSNPHKVTRGE